MGSSVAEAGVMFGFTSDVNIGDTRVGESGSRNLFARYTLNVLNVATDSAVDWRVGLDLEAFSFNSSGDLRLPDALGSVALNLGMNYRISDRWSVGLALSPGVYSDFEHLDLEDFNAPALGLVTYRATDRVLLVAAVAVDGRNSSLPIIGGIGVRWQISRAWALSLLIPKPRLEFTPTGNWRFWLGGELKARAYHLASDFGTRLGVPELNSQFLEYRELRAGLGAEYRFSDRFRLNAELGWLLSRRWDFSDTDLTYTGNGAGYGQVAFNYRF